MKVDVKALPAAGRSRAFAGSVGTYELAAELNREEVEAANIVLRLQRAEDHLANDNATLALAVLIVVDQFDFEVFIADPKRPAKGHRKQFDDAL